MELVKKNKECNHRRKCQHEACPLPGRMFLGRKRARFCSIRCSAAWRKVNDSPETRAKIKAAVLRGHVRVRRMCDANILTRLAAKGIALDDAKAIYRLGKKDAASAAWNSGYRKGYIQGTDEHRQLEANEVRIENIRASWHRRRGVA